MACGRDWKCALKPFCSLEEQGASPRHFAASCCFCLLYLSAAKQERGRAQAWLTLVHIYAVVRPVCES